MKVASISLRDETIQNRQMRLIKVDTSNQLANIFTNSPSFLTFSPAGKKSSWEGAQSSFLLPDLVTPEGVSKQKDPCQRDKCCDGR